MLPTRSLLLSLLPAFISPVFAQTYTLCNPLNETCPADPALGIDYLFNFTSGAPKDGTWNSTAGEVTYGTNGAEFTISEKGQSPTITTNFFIFFGRVEVHMRAASGQGIVSSIVLESDDLDEVDWEFLGGNNTVAETNYFGKGNTTSYDRAIWHPMTDPIGTFHNYTITWTAEKLEWYIDGTLKRTLLQPDADDNGNNYPQTPMFVRLGIWAGGDTTLNSPGTVEWAQGATDYSKGPFTMYVSQCRISDYSSGKEYTYGDMTGSWQSIQITPGNSTVADVLYATPAPTVSEKVSEGWAKTSSGGKIAVYAISGAVALSMVALFGFFFMKRRRAGKLENQAQEARFESERLEMQGFKERFQSNGGVDVVYQGVEQNEAVGSGSHDGGYRDHDDGRSLDGRTLDRISLDERPRTGRDVIS